VYATLPEDQQKKFVQVNSEDDLGDDKGRYSTDRFLPPCLRQMFTADAVDLTETEQAKTADSNIVPENAPEQKQTDVWASDEDAVVVTLERMAVVSGPSLAPNAQLVPGARILPVWEVMNMSSDANSVWTDVRLRAREPNPLGLREEGVEVPMVASGETGIVCVELTIPEAVAGQFVEAHFDMYNRDGNVFGEPLTLQIRVNTAEEERVGGLVQSLKDMGFDDEHVCLEALKRSNFDLSGAVMFLLNPRQ